jgi:hypothetical protein
MSRPRRRWLVHLVTAVLSVVLVILLGILAAGAPPWPPAWAQDANPLERISEDRGMIRVQLTMGLRYMEQAIAQLEAGDEDALRKAERLAETSYRMMRFATHGMSLVRDGQADPLVHLASETLVRARFINIRARHQIANAIAYPKNRDEQRVSALQQLHESLRVARQAAELF